MNMDEESDRPAWSGAAGRRAMQLAAGIVYARVRGAETEEIAALCASAFSELAASGAGENAQICLLSGMITTGGRCHAHRRDCDRQEPRQPGGRTSGNLRQPLTGNAPAERSAHLAFV